jgi:hypothetical protein
MIEPWLEKARKTGKVVYRKRTEDELQNIQLS